MSDPHAITVDVVLHDAHDRSAREIEFLITPRPTGQVSLSDQVTMALQSVVREALALAAAQAPHLGSSTMPDGLELLDLSPTETEELLAAVLEAEPPPPDGLQESDRNDG
jgi:hypothetical protein